MGSTAIEAKPRVVNVDVASRPLVKLVQNTPAAIIIIGVKA